MRALVLMSLFLAALPVWGGEVHGYSADGKMDGKQYLYEASPADILRTPIWKPEADFPPLSARKAQELARREMQSLLGAAKEPWELHDITIADMGDGMHFVYLIQFEPKSPEEGCFGCDYMKILVLMDGSVPKPSVKPL